MVNCNFRYYVWGIEENNTHHFLMTFLSERECKVYIEHHKKAFPNRFVDYVYKTSGDI